MPVAVITGASHGLGLALATALAERRWSLVVDARDTFHLDRAADTFRTAGAVQVVALPGDVTDLGHRARMASASLQAGGADLLVNNASTLGPSPMPALSDYRLEDLERVLAVNLLAPLALTQALLSQLRGRGGRIVNVTSDAASEPYAGWGGYGCSKAALEQVTAILGAENPQVRVYAFDPGDMRTRMHQAAFPGEDISDRPEPETVVPALLRLVEEDLPGGRYRAADLGTAVRA